MNVVRVDSREQDRIKQATLFFRTCKINNEPVTVSVEQLLAGDYSYEGVGVEFKTVEDYISSVKNGRLHKEILLMKQEYSKCFVVIAGDVGEALKREYDRVRRGVTSEQYLGVDGYIGSMASFSQLCPVLSVGNNSQAFKLIRALFEKSTDGKDRGFFRSEVKSENVLVSFLSCIPGVHNKARLIVDKLNLSCLEDLLMVSYDELLGVEGVGVKTADNIMCWVK